MSLGKGSRRKSPGSVGKGPKHGGGRGGGCRDLGRSWNRRQERRVFGSERIVKQGNSRGKSSDDFGMIEENKLTKCVR